MTHVPGVRPAIALVAPSLQDLGGQGVQAQALAGSLCGEGYSVIFIPIDPRFPGLTQSLRRYRYLRTVFNEALYMAQLLKLRRADIVHIFSASYWSFLLAPVPAIVAAKLLGKPVVLHYHSGEAKDHLSRWRRLLAPVLRMVDQIVVPSRYLQTIFASEGYGALVVPNIVDTSLFRYRERGRVRPRLLSVRNLEAHYRIENTLRAFAHLQTRFPDATLDVVGNGTKEQSLRQLVDRLGVSGVRFLGRVEPEMLPGIYAAADIFVNSSVVDNQPVSILEAFAAGLPVVSTPTGDIEAMLCKGEAGLVVQPDDPVAMADAVIRLVQDPVLATRMARRAREEINEYTWSSVGERWAGIYAEVLSRVGEPHRDSAPAHSSLFKI